jgi:hypothetical protein
MARRKTRAPKKTKRKVAKKTARRKTLDRLETLLSKLGTAIDRLEQLVPAKEPIDDQSDRPTVAMGDLPIK